MPAPGGNRITREDVTSMVGARQELGDEMADALGIAIAWAGIAAVNIAFSRQRRD